ncbi:hypothetical protein KP509_14G061600 [Ceratopteris richardii]|uniref:Cytochrome P450 n=3 Tax=Ceratopteris richardii TaxID=49495 RepID=A0A8T2TAE2_CERRI|nr:hypothetical protein KP509_14G061600 [Ceratopteris richardii]
MEIVDWASDAVAMVPAYVMVIAGLISFMFIYTAFSKWSSGGKSKRRMAPSPRALPIIGHMHMLWVNPHQSLYHLSKVYGPVFSLRLGSVPALVVCNAESARQILITHDKVAAGRPPILSIPRTCFGGPDIAFSSPGPYWRLMRQICVTEFFSNKRLEYFHYIRWEELGSMMRSVLAAAGTPVPVLKTVQINNNNVISRMIIGKRMDECQGEGGADNVVSIIVDMISILGGFNPGDYISWLASTDLLGLLKKARKVQHRSVVVFQDLINGRRAIRAPGSPPKDFLDLLLDAAEDTKHQELKLEDRHIRAILMDMYAAGTDTSASTTEWAMSELLANPETLQKAQEELDRVIGRERVVQESDIPNLPYLKGVIYEAMRLHPAAPLLAPHYAMEDCEISGFHVAAGTVLYVDAWAIGKDEKVWSEPFRFRPERFQDSNIDVLGQHFGLIPFGSGRRICPGWRLGLLNVEIVLASLLHGFDWSVAEKPDMDEKFSIIMSRKNKLVATPTPRLPAHVYDQYFRERQA